MPIVRRHHSVTPTDQHAGSALKAGTRRNHFLAIASQENMERLKRRDSSLFGSAPDAVSDYLLMCYWPSSVWVWAVCEKEQPGMILYTDI